MVMPAPNGRLTATNVPLRLLVRMAYGVQDFQIDGGPSWQMSQRYDITAKAEDGFADAPQSMLPMVKTLLADCSKLKVHTETREMPFLRSSSPEKTESWAQPQAVHVVILERAGGEPEARRSVRQGWPRCAGRNASEAGRDTDVRDDAVNRPGRFRNESGRTAAVGDDSTPHTGHGAGRHRQDRPDRSVRWKSSSIHRCSCRSHRKWCQFARRREPSGVGQPITPDRPPKNFCSSLSPNAVPSRFSSSTAPKCPKRTKNCFGSWKLGVGSRKLGVALPWALRDALALDAVVLLPSRDLGELLGLSVRPQDRDAIDDVSLADSECDR